jgi:hypothetical protein
MDQTPEVYVRFIKRAEKLFKAAERQLANYEAPNDFSVIATKILADSDIHEYYDDSVIEEILSLKKLPTQNYHMRNFSDAPVTLFHNPKFYLDIYFWRRSDTDVHNHHFTGAFKMLQGKQHQFRYAFNKAKKLYPFLYQGKMDLLASEELSPGDCTQILLGDDFIHQTVHDPNCYTANICLRTVHLPRHDLYGFRLSGYKIKHLQYNTDRMTKLALLKAIPEKDRKSLIQSYLKSLSLFELASLYKGTHFTGPFVDEDFKRAIQMFTKKHFPQDYQKLKLFFEGVDEHDAIHRKLRFFCQT